MVLVLLALGLDFGLRFWAQSWLASRVAQSLPLSGDADVDLGGFPFLVQVAGGRFDRVSVTANTLEAEGLLLHDVRLELRGVSFSAGELLTRGPGTIHAGSGSGEAELRADELTSFIQAQGHPVEVAFAGSKVRVASTVMVGPEEIRISATGPLRLRRESLRFEPRTVRAGGTITVPPSALALDVPLPELLPGVRYDGLVIRRGVATVEVGVQDAAIRVPGAS